MAGGKEGAAEAEAREAKKHRPRVSYPWKALIFIMGNAMGQRWVHAHPCSLQCTAPEYGSLTQCGVMALVNCVRNARSATRNVTHINIPLPVHTTKLCAFYGTVKCSLFHSQIYAAVMLCRHSKQWLLSNEGLYCTEVQTVCRLCASACVRPSLCRDTAHTREY